tara:strand:+ start:282 stop:1181 length:900 start_codon:yes stop_codon:yes gene_type:complete
MKWWAIVIVLVVLPSVSASPCVGSFCDCPLEVTFTSFEDVDPLNCPPGWTCSGDAGVVEGNDIRCGDSSRAANAIDGTKYIKVGCDGTTGSMISPLFTLPVGIDRITFLRAGGADNAHLSVIRSSDASILCTNVHGHDSDTFASVGCLGLSGYEGVEVSILIENAQTGGWAKVYVDNIQLKSSSGAVLATPCTACSDDDFDGYGAVGSDLSECVDSPSGVGVGSGSDGDSSIQPVTQQVGDLTVQVNAKPIAVADDEQFAAIVTLPDDISSGNHLCQIEMYYDGTASGITQEFTLNVKP